jgi:hypothetical protein
MYHNCQHIRLLITWVICLFMVVFHFVFQRAQVFSGALLGSVRYRIIWELRSVGYYAECNDNILPTFRTTTRSHLNHQEPKMNFDSWPLKMLPIVCPETSVRNYRYLLCCSSEKRSSHLSRIGSVKSHRRALCVTRRAWVLSTKVLEIL